MAGKNNTVSRVTDIISPFAKQMGIDIWDVRYTKEGTDMYLRIFIDKEGGVSVDDCVDFTHMISKPLDDADPIKESYFLEVSSPGIERELVRDEHFEKYIGSKIMIKTIRPIDKVRDFLGVMTAYENSKVTVKLQDDSEMTIDKKDTSYIKLDDFDINDFKQSLT